MVGHFAVSMIHQTLIWTADLQHASDIFLHVVCTQGSRFVISAEGLFVECTEFDSGEISGLKAWHIAVTHLCHDHA